MDREERRWLIMKLSDLRLYRDILDYEFLFSEVMSGTGRKIKLLGAEFSEGRNYFGTVQI
jgi:hypothetical protein